MKQDYLLDPIPCDKYDLLTKEQVVTLNKGNEDLLRQAMNRIKHLENKLTESVQTSFDLKSEIINIKHLVFGKSSEKSPRETKEKENKKTGKRVRLPSERYPNAELVERHVTLGTSPSCGCCGSEMSDSGMTEDSEYLTVIPKKFQVVREKKHIYRCTKCHGDMKTTPAIPRVHSGAYSDEMMIDVVLSKYLELIPMERYAQIAKRSGMPGIAPNTLIQSTHNLAKFLEPIYHQIKAEILAEVILHADETPHRMLEGDKKSRWYFWGFSSKSASYFEARDTRSGDVAADLLQESKCQYLVSDVFSGYSKAVRVANEGRELAIKSAYCNAHARRKFKEAEKNFPGEVLPILKLYGRVYSLEDSSYKKRDTAPLTKTRRRNWQLLYMKLIERQVLKIKSSYSVKSSLGKAINYFLKNFEGLTEFSKHENVPIDNNHQERLLRSPVIGRKTWYGTHSKQGAYTASVMFSLVESCKLNDVNPREYFPAMVKAIHEGRETLTPAQYKAKLS